MHILCLGQWKECKKHYRHIIFRGLIEVWCRMLAVGAVAPRDINRLRIGTSLADGCESKTLGYLMK